MIALLWLLGCTAPPSPRTEQVELPRRAGGIHHEDPTVEPPAIVARVDRLRTERDAARGIAPDDERRHTLLLHLTPSLLARVEALGYAPGVTPTGVLPWLVDALEEAREEIEVLRSQDTSYWFDLVACREQIEQDRATILRLTEERGAARAEVEDLRLALAAEQGKPEGAPSYAGMDWMDDVKVWRSALLRLVGGRTDHLAAMFGQEIARAAVAWGNGDSAWWDNLSAPEQAHWVADHIEHAAMIAADKAQTGQPTDDRFAHIRALSCRSIPSEDLTDEDSGPGAMPWQREDDHEDGR